MLCAMSTKSRVDDVIEASWDCSCKNSHVVWNEAVEACIKMIERKFNPAFTLTILEALEELKVKK